MRSFVWERRLLTNEDRRSRNWRRIAGTVARESPLEIGFLRAARMSVAPSLHPEVPGYTPRTLEVERELTAGRRALHRRDMGDLLVEVRPGADTLWFIVRRPGHGAGRVQDGPQCRTRHDQRASNQNRRRVAGGERVRRFYCAAGDHLRYADAAESEHQAGGRSPRAVLAARCLSAGCPGPADPCGRPGRGVAARSQCGPVLLLR